MNTREMKRFAGMNFIDQSDATYARETNRIDETWVLEWPDAAVLAAAFEQPATVGPLLAEAAKRYRERFLAS